MSDLDLDAIGERLNYWRVNPATRADVSELVDALAAETKRADDAEAVIGDLPHSNWCATQDARRKYEYPKCTCWKSRTPASSHAAMKADGADQ